MFKAVIIEDDEFSQLVLQDLLELHFREIDVIGVYDSIAESLKHLNTTQVDLVFLDMELKDGKGFDLLEQLNEITFEVIITTMHDTFMLDAIKHSAIDYIMKPVTRSAMNEALDRFKKRLNRTQPSQKAQAIQGVLPSRMVIPNQAGLILLEINDIVRLESDGAYSKIFLQDGESHLTSKNLGHYETQLSSHGFFRVHHGHLINLSKVKNYVRGIGGQVVMADGSNVDVSKRRKDAFLQILGIG